RPRSTPAMPPELSVTSKSYVGHCGCVCAADGPAPPSTSSAANSAKADGTFRPGAIAIMTFSPARRVHVKDLVARAAARPLVERDDDVRLAVRIDIARRDASRADAVDQRLADDLNRPEARGTVVEDVIAAVLARVARDRDLVQPVCVDVR